MRTTLRIQSHGLNSLAVSGDYSSLSNETSRIICSQPASIIFSDISELHITDMALISCGNLADASVRIYQVYRAEISSCIFQGERSGALAVVDSSVILFNNTFESNSATTGGGVYIDRSTVNFTRNTFTDNVASINGSGVFVGPQPSSRVSFIQNRFINNRGGGATVYVDHSSEITTFVGNTFANNTADIYAVYGSTSEEASIYYVTPALDIPCPLQPCHTLSHYITESHQYFTSNTTLVFIPGNHALEKGLLIRDITSLTMIGNSSALISSNIVCSTNKPESFTFYNIREVHIHSLAFISCGSSIVGAIVSLNVIYLANISSCTFYNNINRNYYGDIGGALAVVNSTLTLSETTFTNNSAISTHGGGFYTEKSNVTVTGNTFVNNSANGWGGGVYAEGSMLTFVSNLFKDNIASYGGGVEVYNSIVNFTEDTVINNVAGIAGGGLDIFGTTGNFKRVIIRNNTAQSDGGGVSVYPDSSVDFSEGSFMFNTAHELHGGGIFSRESNVTVTGNTFVNNSANGWGGGVYAEDSMVTFVSNLFKYNNASYGGGVEVYNSIVNFTEDTITNNVAGIDGGGIDIYGTTGNFKRIIIHNNTAQSAGGGVSVYPGSRVSFSEGTFMFNTAGERGGCILVVGSTSILNVSESNLTNNSAGSRGGGAYLGGGMANFNMNNIINNFARFNGGGVSVESSTTAIFNFTNNTFDSNSGGGWVVFLDSTSTTFTENILLNSSGNAVYGTSNESTSVLYVTPSPNTRCPAEPCRTFSEYIDQISLYLSSNTTFVFLPGNHSVSNGLLVDGISSLTLCGNSTLPESPSQIFCSKPASFAFKNVADLSIDSLAFDSCGDSIHAAVSIKLVYKANISSCNFTNSLGSGGALVVVNSTLTLTENVFENNSAINGGGVYMSKSVVDFKRNNTLINNSAKIAGGGLMLLNSSVNVTGNTNFSSNYVAGGRREEIDQEFRDGVPSIVNMWAGGAIFMSNSNLTSESMGNITVHSNKAQYGGGLYVLGSNMNYSGYTNLQNNSADNFGGAIYALSASRLDFYGIVYFVNNSASNGGGLQLTENSLCYFSSKAMLYFIGNNAKEYGGAINNEDSKTSAYCSETSLSTTARSDCFFQVLTLFDYPLSLTAMMNFSNNAAKDGGSDVYGGTVDNCNLENCQGNCHNIISSGKAFDDITVGNLKVSSIPLKVCSCDQQKVNCSHSPTVRVYPGRRFSVYVIVVGQRNGPVSSIIETKMSNSNFKIDHDTHKIRYSEDLLCTELKFTMYRIRSDSLKQQNSNLTLYTKGPCSLDLVVQIEILGCSHGFEIRCNGNTCDCDQRLTRFTDECDIETGTILKKNGSEFWVGYDNDSQGLILHPHCPFDYCETDELYTDVDDSDAQCSYNRSGLLCGECGQNLSLVLGSSRCMQCSDSYLALLIPFAIAGILLVLLLFVLRLTVAAGTLHGLIFYANIVQVNSAIFFPPGHANPLTVFIAWLNLDLGIETCFYKGMEAYGKIWLQFVFPMYVWSLVVIIISVSHYSTGRVARLFGRNPIAILATLFLLSYAKLLRTIIAALSVTYPEHPNNSHVAVWLYDGNIKYLGGKHVPLFIIAIVFLLFLFLPYTLLLLLSQWLQLMPKISFFISNYRIKPFLDAYHAPYNDKHRYWIGLLMCIRCVLFLTVIYNALEDPSVNLLSISSAVVGLLTLASLLPQTVYKNWYVGALETFFLLNLGILAASTYHVRATGGNQAAVTFTLLSIAFATFAGIIVYHIAMQVSGTKFWGKIRKHLCKPNAIKYYNVSNSLGEDMEEFESVTSPIVTRSPTYSTLELSIRESVTQLM